MIGKLKGEIDEVREDHLILDVHGVGYEVHAPKRTLDAARLAGGALVLHIETYMREDRIRLFGFESHGELEWFRILQTVQGVGAKVALSILDLLDGSSLTDAIARADTRHLSKAPGVGPKLANRLCQELKDRMPASGPDLVGRRPAVRPVTAAAGEEGDAISALIHLGLAEAEAVRAVAAARERVGETGSLAALIRAGLAVHAESRGLSEARHG